MSPNQSKYQHIFFDLDHTLWDFESNSSNALKVLYNQYLHPYEFSFQDFFNTYRVINEQCWLEYRHGRMSKEVLRIKRFANTLSALGIDDASLSNIFANQYLELSPYQTQLMPGAIELLEKLKAKGYPLHIITNGFEEVQAIKMRESGLNPYFDHIIISEQLAHKKPHPSVFLHALQLAKTSAQTSLMVGDNLEADIVGAQQVGIDGVFYNPHRIVHQEEVCYEVDSLLVMDTFV